MWFRQKFIVRKHERGLLFKDGDFLEFLAPGTYRYFNLSIRRRYTMEPYDLSVPAFKHRLIDYLIQAESATMQRLFHLVETGADELALVYVNERVKDVLGPAERALYWKGVVPIRVERFDLREDIALDPALAGRLTVGSKAQLMAPVRHAVLSCMVPDGHVGLRYVDGELTGTLAPGLHAYWTVRNDVTIELKDMRVKTLEVQGQEILTRDKVALRINTTASYQYTDAAKAVRALSDPLDQLYKQIQFGLRAAVGTRTLDALLEDKTVIDRDIADHLGQQFADIGLRVNSVGVKDIILPGDMKALLGKVVEAEKAAQANVIRRREETNATRSLLNTAKVMESNNVALRLKELETLEKITENVGNLSVVGGLDALMDGLVRIKN